MADSRGPRMPNRLVSSVNATQICRTGRRILTRIGHCAQGLCAQPPSGLTSRPTPCLLQRFPSRSISAPNLRPTVCLFAHRLFNMRAVSQADRDAEFALFKESARRASVKAGQPAPPQSSSRLKTVAD